MKKQTAHTILDHLFPRPRMYTATLALCGTTVRVPIEAPDHARAQMEALRILDDCGELLDLSEAAPSGHTALDNSARSALIRA